MDHLVTRSNRGNNRLDNLVLACHWCNNRRGDMTVSDWEVAIWDLKEPSMEDRLQSGSPEQREAVERIRSNKNLNKKENYDSSIGK